KEWRGGEQVVAAGAKNTISAGGWALLEERVENREGGGGLAGKTCFPPRREHHFGPAVGPARGEAREPRLRDTVPRPTLRLEYDRSRMADPAKPRPTGTVEADRQTEAAIGNGANGSHPRPVPPPPPR